MEPLFYRQKLQFSIINIPVNKAKATQNNLTCMSLNGHKYPYLVVIYYYPAPNSGYMPYGYSIQGNKYNT